jgi:hypothetical protein
MSWTSASIGTAAPAVKAAALGLSVRPVERPITNRSGKLGLRHHTEATRSAIRHGLVRAGAAG